MSKVDHDAFMTQFRPWKVILIERLPRNDTSTTLENA